MIINVCSRCHFLALQEKMRKGGKIEIDIDEERERN
jgi:hypothetical protein